MKGKIKTHPNLSLANHKACLNREFHGNLHAVLSNEFYQVSKLSTNVLLTILGEEWGLVQ